MPLIIVISHALVHKVSHDVGHWSDIHKVSHQASLSFSPFLTSMSAHVLFEVT